MTQINNRNKGRAFLFLLFILFLSLYGGRSYGNDLSIVLAKTEAESLHAKDSRMDNTRNESGSSKEEARSTAVHEPFIRQAYDLAIRSGKKGNHAFGALLVYHDKVILTSENTVNSDKSPYSHAEINLLIKARQTISPEVLRQSTMYTSTAPCMFCCAAMFYGGISKVVYGVSYEAFAESTGWHDKSLHCDKLYQHSGKEIEWIGPILEEEGLRVFRYGPK